MLEIDLGNAVVIDDVEKKNEQKEENRGAVPLDIVRRQACSSHNQICHSVCLIQFCLSSQMCNSICYFFTRYFLTCRNRETVWEILQYVFSDVMEIYDIEEKQTELC